MKIFIGNLGNNVTASELQSLFSGYGAVMAAHVPEDNLGNSRGFGYVIMPNDAEAEQAVRSLNKKPFMEQFISVSEAIHSKAYNNQVTLP